LLFGGRTIALLVWVPSSEQEWPSYLLKKLASIAPLTKREFDRPLPPSLPLLKGEGGVMRKEKFLLPSPRRRGVGGEVKIALVELTLTKKHA
jgi:hypothetical protein